MWGLWFSVPKTEELLTLLDPFIAAIGVEKYGVQVIGEKQLVACISCRIKGSVLEKHGGEILAYLAKVTTSVRRKVLAGDLSILEYLFRFYGCDDEDEQSIELDDKGERICRLFAQPEEI